MDEEQKAWSKQYASNIGTKEILRLGCAIMTWIFIGVGVGLAFDLVGYSYSSIIFVIFLVMLFVFPFIAPSRKPTYSLLRKILGNKNLPPEPFPGKLIKLQSQPRPWWSYLSGIWFLLLDLIILYIIIRYFFK